jgi:hypothetical protein
MKMYGFNQMCSTVRTTRSNKKKTGTQIKFYKAMAVPTLIYALETLSIYIKRKQNLKREMKILGSVAGYTRKDQTRSIKIR